MQPFRRGGGCSFFRVTNKRYAACSWVIAQRHLSNSTSAAESLDISPSATSSAAIPDARFEVAGSPSPLLSVSLSASQDLYTRRGSLVGLAGKAENTVSTLSLLEPFSRAILRIPFLYQRISSTTPVTSLISPNAPSTSITVVHLDGTTDWMLSAKALLAWTGQTLSLRPTVDYKVSMAYWGHTEVTGRGLVALVGRGSTSEMTIGEGESYVVHPGHVLAYSMNATAPVPYRFKSTSFRLQIPNLASYLPDTRFFRVMRESETWRTVGRILFILRTWTRRTIWGDRLFLRFQGPTTLLLQTRASKATEVLTSRDISESADLEPGALDKLVKKNSDQPNQSTDNVTQSVEAKAPAMRTASVSRDGKVTFQ